MPDAALEALEVRCRSLAEESLAVRDKAEAVEAELKTVRSGLQAWSRALSDENQTLRDQAARTQAELEERCRSLAQENQALWDQARAVGAELTEARTRLEEERKALTDELLTLRQQNQSLWDQAHAVGDELTQARTQIEAERRALAEENSALWDQARAIGAELADARDQLEGRVAADSFSGHSDLWDSRFPWPDAYGKQQELRRKALAEAPDVDGLKVLADGDILASAGGASMGERAMTLAEQCFRPDLAVAALKQAASLAPSDADVAQRLRVARRMATPPILITALPKSGSEYLFAIFRKGLGKQWTRGVATNAFPDSELVEFGLDRLIATRASAKVHAPASPLNLFLLFQHYKFDRVVVHVRDPRQALVSYANFMPAVLADGAQVHRLQIPADYVSWPFERQLDWQIDHWLPGAIAWTADWAAAGERPDLRERILFTRFAEMVADRRALTEKILDFYGVDHALFDFEAQGDPKAGQLNFRSGQTDEWRRVLSEPQLAKVATMMPRDLLSRFDWAE